ncbi:Hypothetical protein CINCED_3A014423 [Cinara cedri]|uniref:Uncharacterized protein n=1 Tax=Cinara cedri TaxID=506608 RepID=A0A5E4NJN0_9HEMI|nr:Hypothetical protein CINCED_3A014423 [Cinara cedri]
MSFTFKNPNMIFSKGVIFVFFLTTIPGNNGHKPKVPVAAEITIVPDQLVKLEDLPENVRNECKSYEEYLNDKIKEVTTMESVSDWCKQTHGQDATDRFRRLFDVNTSDKDSGIQVYVKLFNETTDENDTSDSKIQLVTEFYLMNHIQNAAEKLSKMTSDVIKNHADSAVPEVPQRVTAKSEYQLYEELLIIESKKITSIKNPKDWCKESDQYIKETIGESSKKMLS